MRFELLNTIGTLLTVIIIGATAIAAMVQLRHLRAGNQITAMLSIGNNFDASSYRDAIALIGQKLDEALADPAFRSYEIAWPRGLRPPEVEPEFVEIRRAAILVGNTYEELGLLVKTGIVDQGLFLEHYWGNILDEWKQLGTYTAFVREANGRAALWENFEYLAALAEDWRDSHPTTYPKGIRRMEVHNPWPVPPMPASV